MEKKLINMSEQEVLNAFRHTHLESSGLKFCRLQCRQNFSQDGKLIFISQHFYTLWVANYSDDIVKASGVFVAVPGYAEKDEGNRAYFVPHKMIDEKGCVMRSLFKNIIAIMTLSTIFITSARSEEHTSELQSQR